MYAYAEYTPYVARQAISKALDKIEEEKQYYLDVVVVRELQEHRVPKWGLFSRALTAEEKNEKLEEAKRDLENRQGYWWWSFRMYTSLPAKELISLSAMANSTCGKLLLSDKAVEHLKDYL